MMSVKAVVFDLFETLIHDNDYNFNNAIEYLYESILNEGTDKEEFLSYANNYWKKFYDDRKIDNSEVAFEDELRDFKYRYGFKVDYPIKEIEYNCVREMNESELFPDTKETLQRLNDMQIPVYILSNAIFKKDIMVRFINLFDLEKYFVNTYFSADYGIRKPHQDLFKVVYQDIKNSIPDIEKNEVCFVGDNLKADIAGSMEFGFTPIHIKRNGESCEGSIAEVESLSEIIDKVCSNTCS